MVFTTMALVHYARKNQKPSTTSLAAVGSSGTYGSRYSGAAVGNNYPHQAMTIVDWWLRSRKAVSKPRLPLWTAFGRFVIFGVVADWLLGRYCGESNRIVTLG
jgi:hypothetical protein